MDNAFLAKMAADLPAYEEICLRAASGEYEDHIARTDYRCCIEMLADSEGLSRIGMRRVLDDIELRSGARPWG